MSKRGINQHRIISCFWFEEFITQEIGLTKVPNLSESHKRSKSNSQSLTLQQNHIYSLTNYKYLSKLGHLY